MKIKLGSHSTTNDEFNGARVTLRAIFSVYIAFSIPFRFAFVPSFQMSSNYLSFIMCDLLCTVCFSIEILLNLRELTRNSVVPIDADIENTSFPACTTSRNAISFLKEGKFSKATFVKNILFRIPVSLYVSVIATVPLDYCAFSVVTNKRNSLNWLLVNRLLRVLFIPVYAQEIAKVLERRGLLKNLSLHRTWQLFFAMAMAGHWCACVFYFIAENEALEGNEYTWPQSIGLYEIEPAKEDAFSSHYLLMNHNMVGRYIQSLYWAYITMITTGFGDIVPISISETYWCVLSMYLGVLITTCAIANLQLLMLNMDAAQTHFQNKMERIKSYMRYRRLPRELKNRIVSYYEYQWDLLKGADETKFLSELPRSLQQQVSNVMCRDLISSLPVLRRANNALLNALVDCVENNNFAPNDEILKPGEQIKGALLVSRGEVEVWNGLILERKMKRLDRFAEESLFEKKVNKFMVRAKTFCELYVLPRVKFQNIISSQCDEGHICKMRDIVEKCGKSNAKANKLFGTGNELADNRGFKKHCLPDSTFRNCWACIMFVANLFNLFITGLNLMLCIQDRTIREDFFLLFSGYTIDCLFISNLIFEAYYFAFFEEGLVICNQTQILSHFLQRRSFGIDMISNFPLDIFGIFLGERFLNILRLTKILRFYNFLYQLKIVEKLIVQSRFGLGQSLRRVIKLNFVMILSCHWVGCLWFMAADLSIELGLNENWRDKDYENPTLSINSSDLYGLCGYLRSIYWAIVGMSTVGYGDIVPTNDLEITFATTIILFGGLLLPAVVGGLAAYMGNLNKIANDQRIEIGKILTFMRREKLEKSLIDRVLRYYNYIWSTRGGVDEQQIMEELPAPLRQRVALFVNGQGISSIPFFTFVEEGVKEHLVSALAPKVYLPGDFITHYGEIGKDLFLIENGRVQVFSKERCSLCMLSGGDYFGESCLLGASFRRYASVQAITYCDLFVLSKDDFDELMDDYVADERKKIMQEVGRIVQSKVKSNSNVKLNFRQRRKCERLCGSNTDIVNNGPVLNSISRAKINPDSSFRRTWDVLVLFVSLYNAWIIPFQISFNNTATIIYILNALFDMFYFADIYLKCFEFSYIHEGQLISDRDKVKYRFLKGSFKLDMISSLPFDIIALIFIRFFDVSLPIIAILRLPKLIRLRTIGDTFLMLTRLLEDKKVSIAPIRLTGLLLGVCLIAHWAGCGFYAFAAWKNVDQDCANKPSSFESSYAQCRWVGTWIEKQITNGKVPQNGGSSVQHYIRSFHWALPTLVVVVIGDVVPSTSYETLYAFLWMVLGVTVNATIIGSVANIVANLETESSEFIKRADEIKHFMYINQVDKKLRDRVNNFMNYLWSMHRGSKDEGSFVYELPTTLQMAISEKLKLHCIKSCPFFDFCPDEVTRSLAVCLKSLVFSIDDVLIHYGDMGQEMFFLEKGSVEVLSGDGKTVFATLNKGSFFGETGLFFKTKRSTTIKAVSFCEVFRLDKSDLDKELRQCDFDLSRMLQIFTEIKNSNSRRNTALAHNISEGRRRESKLNKVLGFTDSSHSQIAEKKVRAMFMPNSSFRAVWDASCLLFTIYFAIYILYRISFELDETRRWISLDYLIDTFFGVDIYLRYYYFPIYKNGVLVVGDELKNLYRSFWMPIDIISSIPVEILAAIYGMQYIYAFRAIHLLRICRLPSYFRLVEYHLSSLNIRISASKSLLVTMFFYYLIINHWCACGWFIIHRYFERNTEFTWATSDCPGGGSCLAVWNEVAGQHNVCDEGDIERCYLRSFYFVITTISTVGYGDISPVTELETLYEDAIVLIGACIFAGIIGAFGAFLSHSDTSGTNAFEFKLQKLQEYMKYRNLPIKLQENIIGHHVNKWEKSRIIDEQSVMNTLSIPLQIDLYYHVLEPILNLVPILRKQSIIVQKRLAYAMQLQICTSNCAVYSVGDIGYDIYFIGSGLIQVTLPENPSQLDSEGKSAVNRNKAKTDALGTIYRPGNHFGESCLVGVSGVRQENVVAFTVAELYLISKESIDYVCSYMSLDAKRQLYLDLVQRNGNIWHCFEENLNVSTITQTSLSAKHKNNIGVAFGTPNSSLPNRRRRRRLANESKNPEKVRLRSFSAEASKEAMHRRSKRQDSCITLSKCEETCELDSPSRAENAIQRIQDLVRNGEIIVNVAQSDEEGEDSNTDIEDEDCSRDSTKSPLPRIRWMRRKSVQSNNTLDPYI